MGCNREIFLMLKNTVFYKNSLSLKALKNILIFSLPVLPAQIFAFAIPLYSQWSVKEMLSLEELGLYAICLKFTLPITLILGMFQQAYGPYKYEILKNKVIICNECQLSRYMYRYLLGVTL